nr:tryptophan 7-halogenase [Rubrivivax sp.]
MHRSRVKGALTRRHLMGLAAGGLTTGILPLKGWAGDDDDKRPSASSTSAALPASTGLSGQRIVVAGGGMAGMTAAKYLRLWGGSGVQVTLVEPD